MRKNSVSDISLGLGGGVAIIGFIIFLLFIAPWLNFWLCYFGGWIAKIVIGDYIVQGFAIFGKDISVDQIPLISGFLGWFGAFFKNAQTLRNKGE